MAMVHPSRMALVPQDSNPPISNRFLDRSRSPKRRSYTRSPDRNRERSTRDRDYDSGRGRRNETGRSSRSRSRSRDDRDRRRNGRDYDRDRGRSRERDSARRGSPAYDDYKRPEPPIEQAPWRQQENAYPDRRGGGYRHPGGGGADYMESRRLERESKVVDIWPPSPKAPARELSPKRKKSNKKSKRARSSSPSDDSSDDEDRRRRERKERKRARKEREREERREHRRHRSSSRSRRRRHDSDDESEDDDRDRRRHRRSKSKSRSKSRRISKTRSPSPSKSPEPSEDEWVPKSSNGAMAPPPNPPSSSIGQFSSTNAAASTNYADDSDDEVGPKPLHAATVSKRIDERAYGGALLRGEGSAMAAFLKDDTSVRIPRRGEIGLTSDEIAQYESVGYVMSGSRHRRMNAVRMRKENQVISAEEKRGILKLQKEERARREAILREEFTALVDEKLKGADGKTKPPPA